MQPAASIREKTLYLGKGVKVVTSTFVKVVTVNTYIGYVLIYTFRNCQR